MDLYSRLSNINSGMLGPNDTFKHTFMRTGVFDYHCIVHPFMTGKVIVINCFVA